MTGDIVIASFRICYFTNAPSAQLDAFAVKCAIEENIVQQFGKSGEGFQFSIVDFSEDSQTGFLQALRKDHRKILACAVLINEIDSTSCCIRILKVGSNVKELSA
ncbi:hypothetical protein BV898_01816 [Hypsibius exemplaris]|uniref:Uncharacterized protein n=1 Tax=Hypsibius exemplaris TaxID=2072580 RepID=A0A1W0X9R0_HYPEX|nr:hypothetical protein BV898_01816 [Hypsibius exemplaris]